MGHQAETVSGHLVLQTIVFFLAIFNMSIDHVRLYLNMKRGASRISQDSHSNYVGRHYLRIRSSTLLRPNPHHHEPILICFSINFKCIQAPHRAYRGSCVQSFNSCHLCFSLNERVSRQGNLLCQLERDAQALGSTLAVRVYSRAAPTGAEHFESKRSSKE